MGCCISRLKMDQPYEQEDMKTAVPKKSTLLNRNEIKRSNSRLKDPKKKDEKHNYIMLTRETLSKKETSDESNFTGFDNKNLNQGNFNNSQDLTVCIKKLNGVKGQRENNNFIEDYPKYENFEFSDFTTFSKNENPNNCNLISKTYNNSNVMTTAASNNFPFKKNNNDIDLVSLKETNSQYKSTKSNNTVNNYCSIHQINGNFQTQDIELNQLNSQQDFSNKISKRLCAFFLLEINNFVFSSKENFKFTYPEINLLMIIDFNDQINMQEKIFFTKSTDSDPSFNTYYPNLRKDEFESKKFRIGKFFQINNNENLTFKISILLYTFTNYKILPIGSEDIYLKINGNLSEMKKFHMYQNIHQRFINKKVGNLNFDLSYKVDDFYYHQILFEKNILYDQLSEFKEFVKFEEEHEVLFKMNERILEEKSSEDSPSSISKNYLSINDIESNSNLIQLYKSKNITSEKLFKLFQSEKTNRGYYILLKKLNDEMNTTEYTNHKLNNFKILLNKKLQEIIHTNDFTNEIIINLILNVLKKSYYLMGKDKNKSNISVNEQLAKDSFMRKNSSSPQLNLHKINTDSSDIENDQNNNNVNINSIVEDSLNIATKFLSLMDKKELVFNEKVEKNDDDQKDKSGKIFLLLSKNNNVHKNVNSRRDEIPINCMNFLHKFIEEPIVYENKSLETTTTEAYLVEFIYKTKFYNIIIQSLSTYTSYQDCVDPGLEILLKLLKIKKYDSSELIQELNKSMTFFEAAKKIIKVHDCNMKIMTKLLSIIFYIKSDKYLSLISISKLKNIFLIFRNIGFDLIHEVILYLLKTIIIQRINDYHKSNPVKTLTRNNSMSISSISSKKIEKPSTSSSKNNSPNTSLNNSNSSLNNSNSNVKKGSSINANRIQNNSLSPLRTSKTLTKNNTVSSLKSGFKNGLIETSPIKSDSDNDNNNLCNDKKKNVHDNKYKDSNKNSNNIISNSNENNIDYGNQFPFDKCVAEINGGLFSVEELNDVLSIFSPAINMIKSKVYYTEIQKNNKIFYKFSNCLEIISFLILTLITSKDNTDKLKFLIYYKTIENLVTVFAINSNKGVYKDIHLYFPNKQYIMINNKISIIKQFYYLFKIIEMIRERFPNLRDEKLMKFMIDFRTYCRFIVESDSYNIDYLMQTINDIFKDIPIDENNQKNQKINNLEDLKPYLKEMRKTIISHSKK